MMTIIEMNQPRSAETPPGLPAESSPEQSLDALWQRVEAAEAAVRSLEAENKQLRSERTRAVLAAARAMEDLENARDPETDGSGRCLKAPAREIDSADTLHAEAEQDREAGIPALTEPLQKKNSNQPIIVQKNLDAATATLYLKVEEQASAEVANKFDGLAPEVDEVDQALRTATQQHETDLRNLEESLQRKHGAELEALDRRHAAALDDLARMSKQQFANELVSSISAAHASWQETTKERLLLAHRKAAKALVRERARWHRRQYLSLRRAAWVWRLRERRRMMEARKRWAISHRQAIDTCNQRWQSKYDRLKTRVRRNFSYSRVLGNIWESIRIQMLTSKASFVRMKENMRHWKGARQLTRLQAGLMGAVLIFLGINFTLIAGAPNATHEPSRIEKKSAPIFMHETDLLPMQRPVEIRTDATEPKSPLHAKRSMEAVRKPILDASRSGSPNLPVKATPETKPLTPTPPSRNSAVPNDQGVRLQSEIPGKSVSEQMIRERLQQNIRNLRLGNAVQ